jgi:gentisate 1,2-dioxygenase
VRHRSLRTHGVAHRAPDHGAEDLYYVLEGAGETIVDGCRFEWSRGDILVLPSWALHEHANLSSREPAVLFSIQDRPVVEALGLYKEEAVDRNDGHQAVTSTVKV